MKKPREYHPPFVMTDEQFDALKLEISSLSPSEQENLESMVNTIYNRAIRLYGPYIHEDVYNVIETQGGIDKRVTLLDKGSIEAFSTEWPDYELTLPDNYITEGLFTHLGHVALVKDSHSDIDEQWEHLPDHIKQELVRACQGNKEYAKQSLAYMFVTRRLTHEIIHSLAHPSVDIQSYPMAMFAEIGNAYYEEHVLDSLHAARLSSPILDNRNELYQKILADWGEDFVHSLYFGKLIPGYNLNTDQYNKFVSYLEKLLTSEQLDKLALPNQEQHAGLGPQ